MFMLKTKWKNVSDILGFPGQVIVHRDIKRVGLFEALEETHMLKGAGCLSYL